jgi:hypothetical protein
MSRPCPVCAADQITKAKIESARELGSSFKAIAALVPTFNRHQIQRHFRHQTTATASPVAPIDELDLSEKRLATLSLRLEEQYVAALAIADSKVALDITKALARLESERHNRIIRRLQAEEDAGGDPGSPTYGAPKPEWLDKIVNAVRARETTALARGEIVCPACLGLKIVDPSRIAERLPEIIKAAERERHVNSSCSGATAPAEKASISN